MYRKTVRWFLFSLILISSLGCQKGKPIAKSPKSIFKIEERCNWSTDQETIKRLEEYSASSVQQSVGYRMCSILPEQGTPQKGICGQDFLKEIQKRFNDIIYLPHLYSLSAKEGGAIQHLEGKTLLLQDLEQISPDTGSQISCFQGNGISLPNITKLDVETAVAISKFQGSELSLDGLESIDVEVARILRDFKGETLSLDGLESLDIEVARILRDFQGETLSLDGLRKLDPEVYQVLQGFKGKDLWINKWATRNVEEDSHSEQEDENLFGSEESLFMAEEELDDEQLLQFIEMRETSNIPDSWACDSGKVCLYVLDSTLNIVDNRTVEAKYSFIDYGHPRNPIRLSNDGSNVSYENLRRRLEATVRALGKRDNFKDIWIDCYAIALVPRLYHNEDSKRFLIPKPKEGAPKAGFQVMTPTEVNEHINEMRTSMSFYKVTNHFSPENPEEMLSTSFQNPRLRSYRVWSGWNTVHEYESYFVYAPGGKNVYFLDHNIKWELEDEHSAEQFRSKIKERTLSMLHELKVKAVDIETWKVCECDFITGLKDGIDVKLD